MYAMTILDCQNQFHARAMQKILDAKGYPAVAATVITGPETHHIVVTAAPEGVPEKLNIFAMAFSIAGEDGLSQLDRAHASRNFRRFEDAMPADKVVQVRRGLTESIYYAAGSPSAVTFCYPPREAQPTVVNHDRGDEHDDSGSVLARPVKNPQGGGWEKRCSEDPRNRDAYDFWTSGT